MSDLNITTAVDNGDIIIRIPAETAKTLIREEVEFMDYRRGMSAATSTVSIEATIHGPMSLFMSIEAGTAKVDDVEYTLHYSLSGVPIITNRTTNRSVTFSWRALLDAALAAGVAASPAPE